MERSRSGTPPSDPADYLRFRYYERAKLGDLIEEMRAAPGGALYVTYADVFRAAPELLGDVEPVHVSIGTPRWLPQPLRRLLCMRPGFWLGAAGALSPVHFDRPENLHVQLYGRKRWTLFGREQSRALYYPAPGMPALIFSPVDVEHPDLERFPRFRGARGACGVLEPGDAIFVPSGVWHHVRTLEMSISLNYWWWSPRGWRIAAEVEYQAARRRLVSLLQRRSVDASPHMPMR